MDSKKYISPIRLLQHIDIDVNTDINISRAKKLLSVEFSMNNDGFITIEDFVYNKQDIIEELESEDFEQRLNYHKKIWNSPFSLSMLETNQANFSEVKSSLDNFQNDTNFDAFFSPYFVEPFNYAIKQSLDNNQLQDAGNWLTLEGFLINENREPAFKNLRIFLDESERVFNNVNAENFNVFQPQLKPWLNYGWYTLLNNLPDELYQYKNAFVVDLINLSVALEKKYIQFSRIISDGLVEINDVEPNLRKTIIDNDKVFNGKNKKETSYWWVLWLAFILIRAISNGGCN